MDCKMTSKPLGVAKPPRASTILPKIMVFKPEVKKVPSILRKPLITPSKFNSVITATTSKIDNSIKIIFKPESCEFGEAIKKEVERSELQDTLPPVTQTTIIPTMTIKPEPQEPCTSLAFEPMSSPSPIPFMDTETPNYCATNRKLKFYSDCYRRAKERIQLSKEVLAQENVSEFTKQRNQDLIARAEERLKHSGKQHLLLRVALKVFPKDPVLAKRNDAEYIKRDVFPDFIKRRDETDRKKLWYLMELEIDQDKHRLVQDGWVTVSDLRDEVFKAEKKVPVPVDKNVWSQKDALTPGITSIASYNPKISHFSCKRRVPVPAVVYPGAGNLRTPNVQLRGLHRISPIRSPFVINPQSKSSSSSMPTITPMTASTSKAPNRLKRETTTQNAKLRIVMKRWQQAERRIQTCQSQLQSPNMDQAEIVRLQKIIKTAKERVIRCAQDHLILHTGVQLFPHNGYLHGPNLAEYIGKGFVPDFVESLTEEDKKMLWTAILAKKDEDVDDLFKNGLVNEKKMYSAIFD